MRLFELTNNYQIILNKIEDADHIDESIEQELNSLEVDIKDKIKNTGIMIKLMENDMELIEHEINKLKKKKDTLQAKVDWLKDNICINMQKMAINKVENKPYFNINLRLGQPKVCLLDENFIPFEYKKVKETISFDKIKMREEMLEGVVIPGAQLVRENYIEIR